MINKILKSTLQTFCHSIFFKKENTMNLGWKKLSRSRKTTAGFTVLFAVIVSSLILALGLGIVAITMKEVRLSSTGRDSQLAFYAADSGLECAQYFDLVQTAFPTSTSAMLVNPIKCNGQDMSVIPVGNGSSATSTFTMYMGYAENIPIVKGSCALVTVSKSMVNGSSTTVIDSRGYNSCDLSNTRRLERGYRVQY